MTEAEGYIECVLPPGTPAESPKTSPQPATRKLTLRSGGDATHIAQCAVQIHSGNDWVVQLATLTQKVQEATSTLSEVLSHPRSAENDVAVRQQQELLSSLKYDLQRHILAGGTELPFNLMEQLLAALKPGVPKRQTGPPRESTSSTSSRSAAGPVPSPASEEESVYSNMATVHPQSHASSVHVHDSESVYDNFAVQPHARAHTAVPNRPPPVPPRTYNRTYADRLPSTSSSSQGPSTQTPTSIYEQHRSGAAGLGYDTLRSFSNQTNTQGPAQISNESPYDVFSPSVSHSVPVASQTPQPAPQNPPLQVEEEEDDGEHIYECLDMVKKPPRTPPGQPIAPPLFDRGSMRMQRKMHSLSVSSSPTSTEHANQHNAGTSDLPVPPPRVPSPTMPIYGNNTNTPPAYLPTSSPGSSRTSLHSRSNSLTRPLPIPTPTGTPTFTPHSSTAQLMQPLAEAYQPSAAVRNTPPTTPTCIPLRKKSTTSLGGYPHRAQPPIPQVAAPNDNGQRSATMPRSRSETSVPVVANQGPAPERPRAMSVGCEGSRSPIGGVRTHGRSNSEAGVIGVRGVPPAPSLPTLGDEHEPDIYDNFNNFRNLTMDRASRDPRSRVYSKLDADGYIDTNALRTMQSDEGTGGSTGTLDSIDSGFGTSVRMRRKMSSLSKKGSLVRK